MIVLVEAQRGPNSLLRSWAQLIPNQPPPPADLTDCGGLLACGLCGGAPGEHDSGVAYGRRCSRRRPAFPAPPRRIANTVGNKGPRHPRPPSDDAAHVCPSFGFGIASNTPCAPAAGASVRYAVSRIAPFRIPCVPTCILVISMRFVRIVGAFIGTLEIERPENAIIVSDFFSSNPTRRWLLHF